MEKTERQVIDQAFASIPTNEPVAEANAFLETLLSCMIFRSTSKKKN